MDIKLSAKFSSYIVGNDYLRLEIFLINKECDKKILIASKTISFPAMKEEFVICVNYKDLEAVLGCETWVVDHWLVEEFIDKVKKYGIGFNNFWSLSGKYKALNNQVIQNIEDCERQYRFLILRNIARTKIFRNAGVLVDKNKLSVSINVSKQ